MGISIVQLLKIVAFNFKIFICTRVLETFK